MSNLNQPKYPIYIISKGRADTRFTSRSLEMMKVPYRIVIEESEFEAYNKHIDTEKILTLPKDFRENPKYARRCEATGLLGGSIPARNFVWEHSIKEGHDRHWILDDNIRDFFRFNNNRRRRVNTGGTFRACEDFVDRYKNVKMAGMNYTYFVVPSENAIYKKPYYLNSRIYSCILLSNDIDYRWRGRYNEDTDLSLRILKDRHCTMLFNAFLCGKITTLSMKGGNTEEVYNFNADGKDYDDRYEFAKSLQDQHPDITAIVKKFNRWHHHVDYSGFIQKPIYKDDITPQFGINDYGMTYRKPTAEETATIESYWE